MCDRWSWPQKTSEGIRLKGEISLEPMESLSSPPVVSIASISESFCRRTTGGGRRVETPGFLFRRTWGSEPKRENILSRVCWTGAGEGEGSTGLGEGRGSMGAWISRTENPGDKGIKSDGSDGSDGEESGGERKRLESPRPGVQGRLRFRHRNQFRLAFGLTSHLALGTGDRGPQISHATPTSCDT